ncbi:MAG: putative toxin-antitoxin system toxin component, PIN family [Fimbriiglobus sp.]|nr:putative toxin-antitoxin system toxin component, PIN family [Fimbriiglobus sp.]
MNVVVDTSVILSAAILPGSLPARAVLFVLAHGTLLHSAATIAEADRILRKPRFNRYRTEKERLDFLTLLENRGREVDILTPVVACRDPNDDMFLEVAVNGAADYLVSGDADLLALHPFRGIPVVSPADFLAAVELSP